MYRTVLRIQDHLAYHAPDTPLPPRVAVDRNYRGGGALDGYGLMHKIAA
jgi:hypothetical protein